MRKAIAIITLIIVLAVPFLLFDGVLPEIGDPNSAPNTHVAAYYTEHGVKDTSALNLVTGIIVDYRAFDTMFETTVMFLAGLGVVLILSSRPNIKSRIIVPKKFIEHRIRLGNATYHTINKDVMVTILEPLIMIYAMYVLFHGEISLGGGFQAGALLGLVYIIDVMGTPERKHIFLRAKDNSVVIGGVGTFIYALAGILTMMGGGFFLEYDKLPFIKEHHEAHGDGMLLVEVGVVICVMSTIITILNAIMTKVRFDDDEVARRNAE